jgi:hypothetical protein
MSPSKAKTSPGIFVLEPYKPRYTYGRERLFDLHPKLIPKVSAFIRRAQLCCRENRSLSVARRQAYSASHLQAGLRKGGSGGGAPGSAGQPTRPGWSL